jgi:hypothetical protein
MKKNSQIKNKYELEIKLFKIKNMEKQITKDFFLTINEGCLDNQMIRFIISDNNFLTPDLYNNFKGEEFFVKSTKEELKNFSENVDEKYTKLFNKNNIVEVIENIILKHIIGIIGLARKAKKVVIGFDEIKIQLKKNKIYLLLQAESFSQKREKKINLPVYQKCKLNCLTKEELGIAFGKKNIANVGFLKSSFINPLVSDTYLLQSLRN